MVVGDYGRHKVYCFFLSLLTERDSWVVKLTIPRGSEALNENNVQI